MGLTAPALWSHKIKSDRKRFPNFKILHSNLHGSYLDIWVLLKFGEDSSHRE